MARGGWLRSRLLRRCRSAYNSGNFRSSLRRSRTSSLIYNDPSFLDISARSALRMKRFELASSVYRKARNQGWVLRDHHENQFRAEFNSGNWLEAYLVSSSDLINGSSIDVIGKPAFTIKVVSLLLPDISNGKIK